MSSLHSQDFLLVQPVVPTENGISITVYWWLEVLGGANVPEAPQVSSSHAILALFGLKSFGAPRGHFQKHVHSLKR